MKATVRIIEIAELVGVSHQQANKIADAPGFPSPVRTRGIEPVVGSATVQTWAKVWRRWRRWVCGTVRHGCGPRRVLVPDQTQFLS